MTARIGVKFRARPYARGVRVVAIPMLAMVAPGASPLAADATVVARALYEGAIAARSIEVRLGSSGLAVPGSRFPCRSCHGRDGRGAREAGVAAPSIRPHALTALRATRPAYGPDTFAAALRDGRNPAGRTLDPSMPRYGLDAATAAALWEHLTEREAVERRGVEPALVRVGVDARADPTLLDALVRAWEARGAARPHGRAVRFEAVTPGGIDPEVIAVMFGSVEAPASGAPALFPLAPVSEATSPDEVRSLFASREEQLRVLIAAAPADAVLVADGGTRPAFQRALADPERPILGPESVYVLDRTVVVSAEPAVWADLARRARPGTRLYVPVFDVAGQLSVLSERGVHLILADPTAPPGPPSGETAFRTRGLRDRLVLAAVAVIEQALVAAGRDLTRGGLMRAVSDVRYEDPSWPGLDYRRDPLTGTRAVALVRLAAVPSDHP